MSHYKGGVTVQKSIRTIQAEPTLPKRLRVAAYARVSCDKDRLPSFSPSCGFYSITSWCVSRLYENDTTPPLTHRWQQPLRRKSATSPCTGEARYICNSLPRQASLYINSSRGSGGAATAAAQGRWICAFLTARGGWLRCSCKLRGRSQGCRPGRRPDTIRRSRPRSRARR